MTPDQCRSLAAEMREYGDSHPGFAPMARRIADHWDTVAAQIELRERVVTRSVANPGASLDPSQPRLPSNETPQGDPGPASPTGIGASARRAVSAAHR